MFWGITGVLWNFFPRPVEQNNIFFSSTVTVFPINLKSLIRERKEGGIVIYSIIYVHLIKIMWRGTPKSPPPPHPSPLLHACLEADKFSIFFRKYCLCLTNENYSGILNILKKLFKCSWLKSKFIHRFI